MDDDDRTGPPDEERSQEEIDALVLSRPELTTLVMLRDQIQKIRISEGLRAGAEERALKTRFGIPTKDESGKKPTPLQLLLDYYIANPELDLDAQASESRRRQHSEYEAELLKMELRVTDDVAVPMREHPAWPWLSQIHGVAETSAALVVGYIDITRCNTASALWRFAGYGVVNGARERSVKGEKNHFNRRLKTMVWRLIDLQVKLHGPYDQVRRDAKHTYMTTRFIAPKEDAPGRGGYLPPCGHRAWTEKKVRDGKRYQTFAVCDECGEKGWSMGHIEAAARAKAAKLFLSHLWEVWRTAVDLPTRRPFIVETDSNHDMIDPWEFVQ